MTSAIPTESSLQAILSEAEVVCYLDQASAESAMHDLSSTSQGVLKRMPHIQNA